MKKNSTAVNIREIAERAGVSQSTVSIVLNGRGEEMRISKKTQQIVKDIAKEMFITENTVETHRQSLFNKLQANNVADLMVKAIAHGLIDVKEI